MFTGSDTIMNVNHFAVFAIRFPCFYQRIPKNQINIPLQNMVHNQGRLLVKALDHHQWVFNSSENFKSRLVTLNKYALKCEKSQDKLHIHVQGFYAILHVPPKQSAMSLSFSAAYLPSRMGFILCTGSRKHNRNTNQYLQFAATDSSQVSVVCTDLSIPHLADSSCPRPTIMIPVVVIKLRLVVTYSRSTVHERVASIENLWEEIPVTSSYLGILFIFWDIGWHAIAKTQEAVHHLVGFPSSKEEIS